MRRIRIIIEYLFAFLLVSILILAIFSTVAVKFYGDELQSKVIRVINSKIDTKLYAEQINISIFRKFPSASVVLQDVTIWSSHNFNRREFNDISTDTLFYAETVYLHFNMPDLLRKKYSVKKFEAKNGCIRIFTDTKGEGNYRFLKTSEEKPEQDLSFVLSELDLLDFQYMIDNRLKKLDVTGSIYELKLNGKFYRRDFQLKTQSHFEIWELNNKGILYAENQDVKTKINLDVTDSLFQIIKGSVQFDKIIAETSGNFILSGNGIPDLDISAEAKDININSLTKIIPNSLNKQGMTGQGKADLFVSVSGEFSSTSKPFINADFLTRNVSIAGEYFPFQINKLNLNGNYNNGASRNPLTSSLTIQEFSGEIDKEILQGSFSWTNFLFPRFHIKLNGIIDPAPWVNYFDPPAIASANGKILSELEAKGSFNRQDKDKYPLPELIVDGELTFSNVGIAFKNNLLPMRNISGKVIIRNDVWKPSLTGIYGNSDFTIEGIGLNFISSVLKSGEPVIVSGDFFAEHIDLQEIIQSIPLKSGDNDQGFQFPENLNIRCNFFVTRLEKDHFKSENLKGTITYDPPLIIIDSLSML
ncbi:MAG TPA: hypothetical protein ENN61_05165, partial [Bacteroidaceae bacterium]|nr:hypothetical protein [Bacteroidaceae bacterium]